jgi:hypothetical protein
MTRLILEAAIRIAASLALCYLVGRYLGWWTLGAVLVLGGVAVARECAWMRVHG